MPFLEQDDARLFYEVTGEGPPVLFIQGIGVVGTGWKYQTEALEGQFQCLTFDNRGIGQSTSLASFMSIEQMAADALALVNAHGWEKVHVVGHSMGGAIAQAFALASPQRVRSLSFLCTFAKGRQGKRLTPSVLWMGMRTRLGSRTMRRRAFLEMLFAPEYLEHRPTDALAEQLTPVLGRDLADSPAIMMKHLAALGAYDGSGRLQSLADIPTLVVSGERDPLAPPAYGRELSKLIPGSQYVEMPGMAHGVILQDPEKINALLRNHFMAA